ncbi:hypothetical protein DFA_00800 [Cavenderia fasciculata]|uniref:Uncharacterized protein n=1 Tax=Cavenderia fasciculata TaxID=261658 RepID=F4PTV4_CACFS|nr:uncharacterized protein DFA_00800 [Cavenderia fasciculata]EGG20933.1 hypothetical protein DFA_00800 [Cavenderia fasciculata]|eukprot:XP_004358783.1 hypothetical protein DFA_00800 [Cavenderia fasciculata]
MNVLRVRFTIGCNIVLYNYSMLLLFNEERIEEDEGVEEDVKNEVEVIDYRCSVVRYNKSKRCLVPLT